MMRKKQSMVILLITSIFAFFVISGIAINGERSVEKNTNYTYIGTPQELQVFSQAVNAGNSYENKRVILTRDIDMSEIENFTPIGIWRGETSFQGVFDGNGYTISNLTIMGDEEANLGLFGSLGGVVCNLTIEDSYICGSACGAICSIAEDEDAAILNCAVNNVTVDAEFTDVIGGQYLGIRENCVVDGQGDAEELNDNLRNVWRNADMIPVNTWSEGTDGVFLTKEKADLPQRIYLQIKDLYEGKIYPLYLKEEDCYVFCIPNIEKEQEATVFMEYPNGSKVNERIILPLEEKKQIEGNGEKYSIRFWESENTATVYLDTEREGGFDYLRESKEHLLPGKIQVLDDAGEVHFVGAAERIQGRGNDSWNQVKQGFGVKLTEYADILGMGSDNDYILIPGYRNTSWLTYRVVWDMAKELGWKHALDYRMVQLYVDGRYWGLYLLAEKIEAGEARIPIVQSGRESSGYVFQYDNVDYTEKDDRVVTNIGNSYTVVSPSFPSEKQIEYCLNLWNEFEEALYSEDGYNSQGKYYTEYVDLESLAKQWLFYELNGEISIWSSIYYYKDGEGTESEKIYAFHPWDVEHSYTNMEAAASPRLMKTRHAFTNGFWTAMASHEDFKEEVRRQWKECFLPVLEKLMSEKEIPNEDGVGSLIFYENEMRKASELNVLRWGTEQDMTAKANEIRTWMSLRIPYLSENLYKDEFFVE